jgi:Asp-tRNA(Asn)/Glu-tRNA(Gln) amidotransferase A subunit family amidase
MSPGEGGSNDLTELTVLDLLKLLRRRRVSPVEVVDAYLTRISHQRDRDALRRRGEDDCSTTRAGLRSSRTLAVYDIPFTVKDIIATAGVRANPAPA